MRYFFSVGVPWIRDVSTIGLMWMAWLGAPLLWLERAHIVVDFVPMPRNPRWRRAGRLVLHVSMAVGAVVLLWYASIAIDRYADLELNTFPGASSNLKYYPLAVGAVLLSVSGLLSALREDDSGD